MLVTPRLILRPARSDDAEDLHEIFSSPLYMRYGAGLPHESLAVTQAWVDAMVAMTFEDGCDFIIERDGRAIGKCGIWRWPVIGYGIHPDYWGQGLAREAVSAVTAHIFALRHDLPSIIAEVDPRNEASMRLLHSLGFMEVSRREKTFQLGDEWVGTVYFELARPGLN